MMFFLGSSFILVRKKSKIFISFDLLISSGIHAGRTKQHKCLFLRIAAFTGIHQFVTRAPVRQGIKKQVLKPA
jgi:hypothetical protein